jgi:hypothetical protein
VWPGTCKRHCRNAANGKAVSVGEQGVELRTVSGERAAGVEDLAEYLLYFRDGLANSDSATELALQGGCSRQMVGMHVRLELPVHGQAVGAHVPDNGIRRPVRQHAARRLEVEHAVDDRRPPRGRVVHNVSVCAGNRVEEGHNGRPAASPAAAMPDDGGGPVGVDLLH